MRRVGMAVLVVGAAVAGCGGLRDTFTSHAETAARVGSRELKSARVAEIISKLGGPNANPQAAELVTGIWVDMSLFGDRVAAGTMKGDSAAVERDMWPQIAEQKISAWHDSVLARRGGVNPATADSMYTAGNLRLFQHILFQAAGATAADTAKAKVAADKLLPQAKTGDFGALATKYSSDGSKNDKGFLFVAPPGAYVKEFDDAAWKLAPGQVSDVVKSQFGFHIIRRPTLAEARDRFLTKIKEMNTAHQDSLYMIELSTAQALTVKPGVGPAVKSAVSDLAAARKSKKVLVTSKGGDFTVGDLTRWIEALPQTALMSIKTAEDTLIGTFVKTIAQNAILLRQADSAKIQVNPTVYQALSLQYKSQVAGLKEAIGLEVPELSDSSKLSAGEKQKLAGQKVDAYFDRLVAGQAQFRPVPPTVSADLRASGDYKIYEAGVSRAKELIIAGKKADSAAGNTGGARPGLQTAPGGPPRPAPDSVKKP